MAFRSACDLSAHLDLAGQGVHHRLSPLGLAGLFLLPVDLGRLLGLRGIIPTLFLRHPGTLVPPP